MKPWNIKPGMKTSAGLKGDKYVGSMNRYRVLTVESVTKRRGYFTSGYQWIVKFTNGEHFIYFSKSNTLPASDFNQVKEQD